MHHIGVRRWAGNHEAAGSGMSALFVCLASVRDVYLAGLFQSHSPLTIAIVAFSLCSAIFLPLALIKDPESLRLLFRRRRDLFWINATSALGWIAFFYALRTIEPSIVQILFSGVGPMCVVWSRRFFTEASSSKPLSRGEQTVQVGLLVSLAFATAVALGGRSGAGPQPRAISVLGVGLAVGGGVAITINTVLCRRVNDAGVRPTALVGARFLGAIVVALSLAIPSGDVFTGLNSMHAVTTVVTASTLLVVLPIYVNQIGISLASPLTVRIVLAMGPVLIFHLQLIEGRLSSSPYSLASALLYAIFALSAAATRRHTIRAAVPA